MSDSRLDWCSYCKEEKDAAWGDYFGPHDSIFMCADCVIEQEILKMENAFQQIKLIFSLRKRDKLAKKQTKIK